MLNKVSPDPAHSGISDFSYGSVCSGIEAATLAWEELGWRAEWFSEIEPFPCAVLRTRWPGTPNLGDMTELPGKVRAGIVAAPDLLVGGTPCQAFSLSGLQRSLQDPRGLLTLTYVDIANAIDEERSKQGLPPVIACWENVPGCLSTKDNAFGTFIAALAGEDEAFQPGPRPEPGKNAKFWRWCKKSGQHIAKWPQSGCVVGKQRQLAWRVINAQYVGVAQRRKRVFVIASARTDIDTAEILFEFDGVRRDSAPGIEAQAAVAALTANGVGQSGADDNQAAAGHLIIHPAADFNGERVNRQGTEFVKGYRMVAFGEYADDETASTCKARDFKDATDLAVGVQHENCMNPWDNQGMRIQNENGFSATLVTNPAGGMKIEPIMQGETVRRLMPVECERLQGFPDNHTLIPWRGKNDSYCPDGPRYKAVGNSMAVPVMRWIGKRIDTALKATPHVQLDVSAMRPAPGQRKKSPLKWVGGKFKQLDTLLNIMPAGNRLIEPFVGGGSVFLNAGFERNLLNDRNADLINLYSQLTTDFEAVQDLCRRYFRNYNNRDDYLSVRERFNSMRLTSLERAAAFLYLNRHCFKGLVRYNLKGQFNVGYGELKSPYFPENELSYFRKIASRCEFSCGDFSAAIVKAGAGDVVFCDPPYHPLPNKAGFTHYTGGAFSLEQQIELVASLVKAVQRGARAVITNSSAEMMVSLYRDNGFEIHSLSAQRCMHSNGRKGVVASDIIAIR